MLAAVFREAAGLDGRRDAIELRVVLDRPMTAAETALAKEIVCGTLGFPYRVDVVAVQTIVRGLSGKFEEFLSLLSE